MGISVNVGGTQKDIDKGFVNIGGAWKEIDKIFCNIGGVWKEGWVSALLAFAIRSQNTNPITAINCEDGSAAKTLTLPSNYTPYGIATDNEGNIYVSYKGLSNYNHVAKYTPELALIWEYTGTQLGTNAGFYIEVNKNKEVYIVQYGGSSMGYICKLTANGVFVLRVPLTDPTDVRTGAPNSMALDADGNLYIGRYQSYNDNHVLAKFDKNTLKCIWETAILLDGYGALTYLINNIVVTSQGAIYAIAYNSSSYVFRIAKLNSAGTIDTTVYQYVGSSNAQIKLCCDADYLYLHYYDRITNKGAMQKRAISNANLVSSSEMPTSRYLVDMDISKETILGITHNTSPEIYKFDKNNLSITNTFTKTGLDIIRLQGGTIGVFQSNW